MCVLSSFSRTRLREEEAEEDVLLLILLWLVAAGKAKDADDKDPKQLRNPLFVDDEESSISSAGMVTCKGGSMVVSVCKRTMTEGGKKHNTCTPFSPRSRTQMNKRVCLWGAQKEMLEIAGATENECETAAAGFSASNLFLWFAHRVNHENRVFKI